MVFVCQLGQAVVPSLWSNTSVGVAVGYFFFLGVINISVSSL